MIVVGGFYSLIHLIIIVTGKTIRIFKMNKLLSYVTIRVIILLVIFSVYSLASGALADRPNVSLYTKLFNSCVPIEKQEKENKVILRIDDIQAFVWTNIQQKMIQDSIERGITPVLGVIPYGIEDDKEMYSLIYKNRCNLEVAQHGWNHSMDTFGMSPEFSDISREEAYDRIMKGKPILEKLAGKELTTFIPPNNSYSAGSELAIVDAGFKIISSQGEAEFDFTASTYNSEKEELNPVDQVVQYCSEALAENNLCIIMVHPQDYAKSGVYDEEKYLNFISLLDKLKELDVMFVKTSDFNSANNSKMLVECTGDMISDGGDEEIIRIDSDSSSYLQWLKIFNEYKPLSANSYCYKLD